MIDLNVTLADHLTAIICEGVQAVLAWPANDVLTPEDAQIVAVARLLAANGYTATTGPTQPDGPAVKRWCARCWDEVPVDAEHDCTATWPAPEVAA